MTLAAFAAGTPATSADELSDLVAAVAASMEQQGTASDILHPIPDSRKPRYRKTVAQTNVNVRMLDGILSSMKRESFRNMRRELFYEDEDLYSWDNGHTSSIPTRPDFFRPVPGIITSNFGWRPKFNRLHHGVDLALQVGDTVRAAVSGTIDLIAYDHDGYGHYVVMTHPDGMETLYGHLEYALVCQGQFVYAGQPVGIGGNTGNSTGPHLHFETRLGGLAVDPTIIFDFSGRSYFRAEESPVKPQGPIFSHQSKSLRKESSYIVRFGDTAESVARQAGISVMRLCQLNMLNENEPLPIGRMLKLK